MLFFKHNNREGTERNQRQEGTEPGRSGSGCLHGMGVVGTVEAVADAVVTTGTGVLGVIVGIVVGTAVLCVVGRREGGVCTVPPGVVVTAVGTFTEISGFCS